MRKLGVAFGVVAAAVLLAAFAFAQSPAQKPAGKSYVIKAARLFDGKSNSLVTPGLVVVTDNKIFGVGSGASIPSGAETIDLGDATLLPGFIDAHTHLTMDYYDNLVQGELESLEQPIPEMALDASVNARVTLMDGFTSVRDVGSAHYLDAGLRNAINKGVVPGPRMLVAVHAIGATGGHCDETGFRHGVFGKETG